MGGGRGGRHPRGFDVVIGNPPWERIKLQEQEFFSVRDDTIANAPKTERRHLIKSLQRARPDTPEARLFADFQQVKRTAQAANIFARGTDRFPLTGTGDVNTYALFAELFSHLARKTPPGSAGILVPTGIATDAYTSKFFANLVQHNNLRALYDFENKKVFFPEVHASFKFSILAIGPAQQAKFASFLHSTSDLENSERIITLTPDDFSLFNPNSRTIPLFRTLHDQQLTRKIYQNSPILIHHRPNHQDGDDNPWNMIFQSVIFHMSSDSGLFRTAHQLYEQHFEQDGMNWHNRDGDTYVPLYEAKMIHHYDHRFASFAGLETRPGIGALPEKPKNWKTGPAYEVEPWYWVPQPETQLRLARIPTRLKTAYRKQEPNACLQIITEWLDAYLSHTDPAASAAVRKSFITDLLGSPVQYMNNTRSTPVTQHLTENDIAFVREAPSDPLQLTETLIHHKQPHWLMGFRDITGTTVYRTVIGTTLPSGIGTSLPIWHLSSTLDTPMAAIFIAQLSSMTLDYAARQKVAGTHLNLFYAAQLPILPPDRFTRQDRDFLVPRVLELTYTSHAMRPWATDLGYTGKPFPFDTERRAQLRAEIDAAIAMKYNLTRDELNYILDPADIKGPDYPSETFAVLKRRELRDLGEYRTKTRILRAFDHLTNR